MDEKKLLEKINNKYKKQQQGVDKLIDTKLNYIIKLDKHNKNLLYLKVNKKIMYSADYTFYGLIKNNDWIWANNIDEINDHVIKTVHALREKKDMFMNMNHSELQFYYKLLSNNKIKIENTHEVNMIKKLLIYLNNDIIIFNHVNENDNSLMVGIRKIKENYT
jgi:hypothetical protein